MNSVEVLMVMIVVLAIPIAVVIAFVKVTDQRLPPEPPTSRSESSTSYTVAEPIRTQEGQDKLVATLIRMGASQDVIDAARKGDAE